MMRKNMKWQLKLKCVYSKENYRGHIGSVV